VTGLTYLHNFEALDQVLRGILPCSESFPGLTLGLCRNCRMVVINILAYALQFVVEVLTPVR